MSLADIRKAIDAEKKKITETKKAPIKARRTLRNITIAEFNDLDAILRRHNHGKNRVNREEIMNKIFQLVKQ